MLKEIFSFFKSFMFFLCFNLFENVVKACQIVQHASPI